MSVPDHSTGLSSHGTSCCLGNCPGELEGPQLMVLLKLTSPVAPGQGAQSSRASALTLPPKAAGGQHGRVADERSQGHR